MEIEKKQVNKKVTEKEYKVIENKKILTFKDIIEIINEKKENSEDFFTIVLNKKGIIINTEKINGKDKLVHTEEFKKYFLINSDKTLKMEYNINHIKKSKIKKNSGKFDFLKKHIKKEEIEKENKEENLERYYRVIYFRKLNEYNFNEYLEDENDNYFIIKIRKEKGHVDNILKDLENYNGYDKDMKKDFYKSLNIKEEYIFSMYMIIEEPKLEILEEKTKEIIKKYIENGIDAKIYTHINYSFFNNLLNKHKHHKMLIETEQKREIINYIGLKTEQKSTQKLFKIEIDDILEYDGQYYDIYSLKDIDYAHAKDERKKEVYETYKSMLNSCTDDIVLKILVSKNLIDIEETKYELFAKSNLKLNDSYNDYILDNIKISAENSSRKSIYLIIIANPEKRQKKERAAETIANAAESINSILKKVSSEKTVLEKLEFEKKIKIFKNFFDCDFEGLSRRINFDIQRENITDYISPTSIKYKPFSSQHGRYFSACFAIQKFPNSMSDDLMLELMKLPYKLNIAINLEFNELDKTIERINKTIFSMETKIISKKNKQNAYISHDFKNMYNETLELRDEVTNKDKKMFFTSITVTVYERTEEELNEKVKKIDSTIRRYLFKAKRMFMEQENGLLRTFPLPTKLPVSNKRSLLSENVACLIPFYIKPAYDPDGIFYGLSEDNDIIAIDRTKDVNSSGWFLGVPGSGKSFLAKKEMNSVILRYPNDDILIIDPENEYGSLAKEYDGENIKISSSSNVRINPFDITENINELNEDGEENPIKLKQEFLLTFIEVLAEGLTQGEKSIVDRILTSIYYEYKENLRNKIVKKPTLELFYERLYEEPEPVAMGLAIRIELYVKGSLNLFSGETNVETNKRIVNFNIKELGGQLKNVGLLLICDLLWNRICKNRDLKKRTWIYIDEIYLLFENEASAKFLFAFYKRVRKYGGVPTGITQNVEDLLRSDTARTMLSNAAFLCILRQSTNDRELLQDLFDLSDRQADYTKNNPPGTGIILNSGNVIHFRDKMDNKSDIYKLMTTKIDE